MHGDRPLEVSVLMLKASSVISDKNDKSVFGVFCFRCISNSLRV